MDVLAALTDQQQAVIACVAMLLGSTLILAVGHAIGRWTGRDADQTATQEQTADVRPFPAPAVESEQRRAA